MEGLINDHNNITKVIEDNKNVFLEEKSQELEKKSKTTYLVALTITVNRIFRVALAYINYRLNKIKNNFWESGGNNPNINEFLSEKEKEFYYGYKTLIANY